MLNEEVVDEERQAALVAALVEIERHVGRLGWDQPARLFALVPTAELLRAEPQLVGRLPVTAPDALSSIEQDEFHGGHDLAEALERIQWPEAVAGCALALERAFLPSQYEADIPADADASEFVAQHPQRQEMRVVAGVMREGSHHGIARLKSQPDELLGGADLAPGLVEALRQTLR